MGYAIGTILAPFKELEEGLMRIYYDMLPIGGVQKLGRKELWQMDGGCNGVGLPHPRIECLIRQINKLLTHHGSPTGLGNTNEL